MLENAIMKNTLNEGPLIYKEGIEAMAEIKKASPNYFQMGKDFGMIFNQILFGETPDPGPAPTPTPKPVGPPNPYHSHHTIEVDQAWFCAQWPNYVKCKPYAKRLMNLVPMYHAGYVNLATQVGGYNAIATP